MVFSCESLRVARTYVSVVIAAYSINVDTMLCSCWATVCDAGHEHNMNTTLSQSLVFSGRARQGP